MGTRGVKDSSGGEQDRPLALRALRWRADCASIGPAGVAARVGVGGLLLYLALLWRDPTWADAGLGLLAVPGAVTALLAMRARRAPSPLRATGPLGHAANTAILVPLLFLPATAGPAMLFYGASMLVAAARRAGGCEVTAIPNALLHRDDHWGCALFAPVDVAEALIRERTRQPPRGARSPAEATAPGARSRATR